MRRLLAAVLAVPVILAIYASRSLRRPVAPQALLALALPVLLLGLSVVRMELTPRPVAAGVAGVAATPFPDTAFAPVSIGATKQAGTSSIAVSAETTPGLVDHPDRDLGGTRREAAARESRRPPVPSVVRFRPAATSTDVAPTSEISVRFTQPMDEAATARTFTVSAAGEPVRGAVRWAEGSTVLVFRPAKPLAAGASVVASVSGDAVSARGVGIARASTVRFTVATPAPKATTKPATKPTTKPKSASPKSSGAKTRTIPRSVAPGLYGVELYALELMNCTRTGGWVLSNGSCRGGGSRNVAPLKLDKRLSDTVARPYAQLLASRRLCNHFYDGNPGNRLRRAGFGNWDWAENVGGCGSNVPYASVLSTHLYFQSEKNYNGGHYRNLMNRKYDRVGIGIVKVKGVFRMVVDFYHP